MTLSLPQRKRLRLPTVDYANPGAYFITICTHDRACLFGEIIEGNMRLNAVGVMAQSVWESLPDQAPHIVVDAFVVMPNHVHGIVWIQDVVGAAPRGGPPFGINEAIGETIETTTGEIVVPNGPPRGAAPTRGLSLPDIMHRFKSFTTTKYRHAVIAHGWPPFHGKLWQRGYYDHVIRNEADLHRIRQYIHNNPMQWAMDEHHPDHNKPIL